MNTGSNFSLDRLGTAASTRGFMTTGFSFRPSTQMSFGVLSCTSSANPTPMLKSTYLPDYENHYRSLEFGIPGGSRFT